MKALSLIAATAFLVVSANAASAQAPDYLSQNRAAYRSFSTQFKNGVTQNGRCGGISYGTGARSCGTATGGPVGGISGRN